MKSFSQKIKNFLMVQNSAVSITEILLSIIGGFVGIFLVLLVSHAFVDGQSAVFMVASMGASAVLLFAVPHGALSQPWPLMGSHMVSALIGVVSYKILGSTLFSSALAVALSIGAMHLLRCLHPPGGATALVAVTGGNSIYDLGFEFVYTPVLINVMIILVVAVSFSYPFAWRRYPVSWIRATKPSPSHSQIMSHADLIAALKQTDSFIDVTEEDLIKLYELTLTVGKKNHNGGIKDKNS